MMINTEPITEERTCGSAWWKSSRPAPSASCFVKGDPDLEFQYVAKAIDIAKGARIDKVGLMTAKMEAGE